VPDISRNLNFGHFGQPTLDNDVSPRLTVNCLRVIQRIGVSFRMTTNQPMTTDCPKTDQPRVTICHRRYGGYPISKDVALEWANRIRASQPGKRLVTTDPCDAGNILLTLDEVVVEAGGVKCNFHGRRKTHGFEEYIIVTTEEWGVCED